MSVSGAEQAQSALPIPNLSDAITPGAPLKFSKTFPFPFEDNETRMATTKRISSEVSAFLRIWLSPGPGFTDLHTHEAQASLASRCTFVCGPEEMSKASITAEQSDDFQSKVSARIKEFLQQPLHLCKAPSLHFLSNYSPREDLFDLLKKSGINCPQGSLIFPKDSRVSIKPVVRDFKPINEVEVLIDFTTDPPLQPNELKAAVLDPKTRLNFRRTLTFENEQREEAVANASGQVADFLAIFLTDNCRTQNANTLLGEKGTSINPTLFAEDSRHGITPKRITLFKSLIVARVQENLAKDWRSSIELFSTDVPEEIFKNALKGANIGQQLSGLYPERSSVSLSLRKITDKMGEIEIDVSFANLS